MLRAYPQDHPKSQHICNSRVSRTPYMATRQPGTTPKYGNSWLHTRVTVRDELDSSSLTKRALEAASVGNPLENHLLSPPPSLHLRQETRTRPLQRRRPW